jgi:antitoxin component YwqK of YwqJK toxin-antitoxin module
MCILSIDALSQNITDNKGLKQGKWTWEKDEEFSWTAIMADSSGKNSDSVICHVILKDGFYKDNKRDSLWHEYKNEYSWQDKKVIVDTISELKYKNNKLNGNSKFYQSNGKLKTEIFCNNGLPHGPIKLYDNLGNLQYTGFYDPDNSFIDLIEYDSNSTPKKLKASFSTWDIKLRWLKFDEF